MRKEYCFGEKCEVLYLDFHLFCSPKSHLNVPSRLLRRELWHSCMKLMCYSDLFSDCSPKTLSTSSVRKRHREERIASTAQKIQQMKQRLTDSERKREKWLYWRPILLNVGAGAALAVGLLVCWMYSQWNTLLGHLQLTLICTSTWS